MRGDPPCEGGCVDVLLGFVLELDRPAWRERFDLAQHLVQVPGIAAHLGKRDDVVARDRELQEAAELVLCVVDAIDERVVRRCDHAHHHLLGPRDVILAQRRIDAVQLDAHGEEVTSRRCPRRAAAAGP